MKKNLFALLLSTSIALIAYDEPHIVQNPQEAPAPAAAEQNEEPIFAPEQAAPAAQAEQAAIEQAVPDENMAEEPAIIPAGANNEALPAPDLADWPDDAEAAAGRFALQTEYHNNALELLNNLAALHDHIDAHGLMPEDQQNLINLIGETQELLHDVQHSLEPLAATLELLENILNVANNLQANALAHGE